MRRILFATAGIFASFLVCSGCTRSDLATPEGNRAVYDLEAKESEVVDVVEREWGHAVYVVSPAPACGGKGEPSFLSCLRGPSGGGPLRGERLVELGLGEATSVAAHPFRSTAYVVMKGADRPNVDPGRLLVIHEGSVVKTVPVDPGPDSVAISPDGRFAVIASEAETPDPGECAAEKTEDDVPGGITVVDLAPDPRAARVAAVISGAALYAFFRDQPARAASPKAVEPEFVAIAPDSSFALITLQEQSAVAVIDLKGFRESRGGEDSREALEARGREALIDVVLLPHGVVDPRGLPRGTHPDGIAVSPGGSYALTANEAHPRVRELQGISVLDLRAGLRQIKVAGTYSIVDLDPTLLQGARIRTKRAGRRGSVVQTTRLPRLDPEGAALARRGPQEVAAIAIERQAPTEPSGSVLLLDMTGVLEGRVPQKVERVLAGMNPGARPETVKFTKDGRLLYVAQERDAGSLTVIDLGRLSH